MLLACGVAFMLVWYPLLQHLASRTPFDLDPFHPALLGLAFNSMLDHLMQGRFDIAPAAIGFEAFLVDGRTVAYFGPFCALLRLPLVPFGALAGTDITRLSCLFALCLSGWFQLRAVLLVRDTLPPSPRRTWLAAALIASVLLAGPLVPFLRPSIYQEVVDWADAEAMAFVFLALRGLLTARGFDRRTLLAMALCAGLALLTRVSVGLGLYVGLGLLLAARGGRGALAPGMLLLAFAGVAAGVNAGRWGNPLIFADFTRYAMNQDVTLDRIPRLAAYGAFNLARLPLGLSYYFAPVWGILRPDGLLLFAESQARLVDAMELPPGSFLLTDPLLLGLAAIGVTRLRRWPEAALLAGLAIPPLLMLTAISMAHRYRMEFTPCFLFAALLGWRALAHDRAIAHTTTGRSAIARGIVGSMVVLSILTSHAEAALYAVSPWGPAEQYVAHIGWIATYAPRLRAGHD